MALMIISAISIMALTGITWFFSRLLPWRICAICAGVSGTWLWMIGARILGYNIDMLVPAVLMGGSVVGLAYQLEARLPSRRSPLLWKTLFVPVGFMAVLYLLSEQWLGLVLALWALVVAVALFFYPDDGRWSREERGSRDVSELERKMDKCC
jgi:hypothetical protein